MMEDGFSESSIFNTRSASDAEADEEATTDNPLSGGSIFDMLSSSDVLADEDAETDDDSPEDTSYTGPHIFDEDIGLWLRTVRRETLDQAPFGIIEIDRDGTIVFYNATESRYADLAPEEAEGQNFFTDVAPCTNNGIFRGRFEEHAEAEAFDEGFRYVFTYRFAPTTVTVRLLREGGRSWILIRPEDDTFKKPDDDAARKPFGDDVSTTPDD